MNPTTHPCCPTCCRPMATAMRWARLVEPDDAVIIELDAQGDLANLEEQQAMDVSCTCGASVRVGRDFPQAAA